MDPIQARALTPLADAVGQKSSAQKREVSQQQTNLLQQGLTVSLSVQYTEKFSNAGVMQPNQAPAPRPLDVISVPKISPETAANNILSFVARRAEQLSKEGGAELDSLLDRALGGIKKGYQQARDILKDLGMMNESLSQEIDQSFELVSAGVQQLREGKPLDPAAQAPANPAPTGTSSEVKAPVVDKTVVDVKSESAVKKSTQEAPIQAPKRAASSAIGYQSMIKARTEISGTLSIRTREGDTVYLSEKFMSMLKLKSTSEGEMQQFLQRAESYFYVEGDLNEDELQAIDSLIRQSAEIASAMSSGNFRDALDQALALEWDAGQLASFALDIQMTQQYQQKTTLYGRPGPNQALANTLTPVVSRLPELAQSLDLLDVSTRTYAQFLDEMLAAAKSPDQMLELAPGISSLVREMLDQVRTSVA